MKRKTIAALLLLLLLLTACGGQTSRQTTLRIIAGEKPLPKTVWEKMLAYPEVKLQQIVYGMAAGYPAWLPEAVSLVAFHDDSALKNQLPLFGMVYGDKTDITTDRQESREKVNADYTVWLTSSLAEEWDLTRAEAWPEGGRFFASNAARGRRFSLLPYAVYLVERFAWAEGIAGHTGEKMVRLPEAIVPTTAALLIAGGVLATAEDEGFERAVVLSVADFEAFCQTFWNGWSAEYLLPFYYIDVSVPNASAFLAYAEEQGLDTNAFAVETR